MLEILEVVASSIGVQTLKAADVTDFLMNFF
jgi:hypothetical protein